MCPDYIEDHHGGRVESVDDVRINMDGKSSVEDLVGMFLGVFLAL